jgi:hypothetical protein
MNKNTVTQNPFGGPIFGAQQQEANKSFFNNPVKPTAPSTFTFGPTLNTQQPQPNQSFFNVKNTAPTHNGFFSATPPGVSTSKTENEDSLVKIENIISKINTATDDTTIKTLTFRLNYLIKGIYNNTPEIKNNFSRMHQLSRKLEDIDLDKTFIKFFLKIHAESKTFLKHENKDWLAKNLFRATDATRDAVSRFMGTDMHCIVAQNFMNENTIAVKFFSDANYTFYEYILGEFPTKESFINSVFFDISCCYICNLWNTYNPDCNIQIKTTYNTKEFTKSKIKVIIGHLSKSNTSLGVNIKVQDLFINLNENPSHCLNKWFTRLDEIATRLNLIDNTNSVFTTIVNTLPQTDNTSNIKAISDIKVFYNTLTCFLEK